MLQYHTLYNLHVYPNIKRQQREIEENFTDPKIACMRLK
jgi:hypothetical protein